MHAVCVCVWGGMCGEGGMHGKGVGVGEEYKRAIRILLECFLVSMNFSRWFLDDGILY